MREYQALYYRKARRETQAFKLYKKVCNIGFFIIMITAVLTFLYAVNSL